LVAGYPCRLVAKQHGLVLKRGQYNGFAIPLDQLIFEHCINGLRWWAELLGLVWCEYGVRRRGSHE
jgi:hypothetical protein